MAAAAGEASQTHQQEAEEEAVASVLGPSSQRVVAAEGEADSGSIRAEEEAAFLPHHQEEGEGAAFPPRPASAAAASFHRLPRPSYLGCLPSLRPSRRTTQAGRRGAARGARPAAGTARCCTAMESRTSPALRRTIVA